VKTVYDLYDEVDIPIIGVGGISSADDALQVVMAGAELYGIGSAVNDRGLEVFTQVNRGFMAFMEDNRITDAAEIVGYAHRTRCVFFKGPNTDDRKDTRNFNVLPLAGRKQAGHRDICTVLFNARALPAPQPGQFYMLWLPGIDQKPYSVSFYNGEVLGFSVLQRGGFSNSLIRAGEGDPVGLLGPLGRGFDLNQDGYLLIGGGIGCAPLVYTAMCLQNAGKSFRLLFGGKDCRSVSWIQPLLEQSRVDSERNTFYCTEDGSVGYKGMLTEHLLHVVDEQKPEFILICGPELLISSSVHIFMQLGIPGEASIERMMKCGTGICGSCSMDPTGDRVCVEGPVFPFSRIAELAEFGRYHRDESGTVQELF
jgi:dihydroorotate dehydrogenase electron transfer subunit